MRNWHLRRSTGLARRLMQDVTRALQHEPDAFGITLDDGGWTDVHYFVEALRRYRPEWAQLTEGELANLLARFGSYRFEQSPLRLRAAYGHSLGKRIVFPVAEPLVDLFHATDEGSAFHIAEHGLRRASSYQYVNLAAEKSFACRVRRLRKCQPIVFRVRAVEANKLGTPFYRTSTPMVWLADMVDRRFLEIETRSFKVRLLGSSRGSLEPDVTRPPPRVLPRLFLSALSR